MEEVTDTANGEWIQEYSAHPIDLRIQFGLHLSSKNLSSVWVIPGTASAKVSDAACCRLPGPARRRGGGGKRSFHTHRHKWCTRLLPFVVLIFCLATRFPRTAKLPHLVAFSLILFLCSLFSIALGEIRWSPYCRRGRRSRRIVAAAWSARQRTRLEDCANLEVCFIVFVLRLCLPLRDDYPPPTTCPPFFLGSKRDHVSIFFCSFLNSRVCLSAQDLGQECL
jgi:hypothetical protein